jgi:hypothetical protein
MIKIMNVLNYVISDCCSNSKIKDFLKMDFSVIQNFQSNIMS